VGSIDLVALGKRSSETLSYHYLQSFGQRWRYPDLPHLSDFEVEFDADHCSLDCSPFSDGTDFSTTTVAPFASVYCVVVSAVRVPYSACL